MSKSWHIGSRIATYKTGEIESYRLFLKGVPEKAMFRALDIGDENDNQVAIIPLDESNEENAHLIAAAPDLLAACEVALCALYKLDEYKPAPWICNPFQETIRNVYAAIIKARGNSQNADKK